MIGPTLFAPTFKQQSPKNYEDQASQPHSDEIFHCVILCAWGCGLGKEVTHIREDKNSPPPNNKLSTGVRAFPG